MKMKNVFLMLLVLFNSCKTQIIQDYHCDIEFGIHNTNVGNVVVDFVKNDFYKQFEYYIYRTEECPGPISSNCTQSYTFYDQKTLLLLKDVIASNECFVLDQKQKYIFPIYDSSSFRIFTSSITNEKIKDELVQKIKFKTFDDSLSKEVMRIDKKGKRELLKVKVENIDVYEFEINTEQLNYYIKPNGILGAIFTYRPSPRKRPKC